MADLKHQTQTILAACWLAATVSVTYAQEPIPKATDPLAASQKQLADQIERLEALLLRSADIEALDNPTRAALLQQAVQLSKQTQLNTLLEKASQNLNSNQLSEAIDSQKAGREALKKLLELLQSENREKRVREQRDQVRRWIEDADRLLRMQSSLRGRTEGGQDASKAAEDQSKLGDKAEQIAGDLKGEDSVTKGDPKEVKSSEPPSNRPDQDGKSQDGKSQDGKSQLELGVKEDAPRESTPTQPKSDSPAQAGEQQSQSGDEKSPASPGEQGSAEQPQSPPQAQTPTQRAQEQIEQAQQRMQEAEEALKKAEREGAIQKQREAETNLKQAIQNLEEILKQLREEEIKRSLETLSTRLRRMLDMQTKILEETQRLNQIAGEEPDRQILARSSTLARDQQKVAAEGERALLLLKEEGSSAAFPEALIQVNLDAAAVANRLDAGDVGKITLVVQGDIVQALEEMVEALAKIKKENDEKKEKERQMQQPGGGGQGESQQQPLINKLAELRLIRTLQIRVNKRTTTLSQMLDNPADVIGQAKARDLLEQLQELSKRQESIESVTRKTAAGDKAP